jgi:hypothetical protein
VSRAAVRITLLCLAVVMSAAPLASQQKAPAFWRVRFDEPDTPDSLLFYVEMPPGWHMTTGPAAILYDPEWQASGRYRVTSDVFIFPGEHREGFGVFVGGRNLTATNPSYLDFQIRGDGYFQIRQREGGQVRTLSPWQPHPSIVKQVGESETAKNSLSVDVEPANVTFHVNGDSLTTLVNDGLLVDGTVGFRVDRDVNVHVTDLTIERRFGPRR